LQTRTPALLVAIIVGTALLLLPSCVTQEYTVTETYYDTEYRTEYKTETYTDTELVVTTTSGEDMLAPKVVWNEPELHIETEDPWTASSFPPGDHYMYGNIWYLGYELPQHTTSHVELTTREPLLKVFAYDVSEVGHTTRYHGRFPTYTRLYNPMDWWKGQEEPDRSPVYESWNLPPLQVEQAEKWLTSFNSKLKAARYLGDGIDYSGPPGSFLSSIGQTRILKYDTTGVNQLAIIPAGARSSSLEPIETLRFLWSNEATEDQIVTSERQVPYQVPYQVEKQRTVTETRQVPFWEAIFGE